MRALFLVIFAIFIMVMVGCSSTATPDSVVIKPSTPISKGGADPTVASLAEAGKNVYELECVRCHSETGRMTLIGDKTHLLKFGNAKKLLDEIVATMPPKAEGSLSHEEYVNITLYILLKNQMVSSDMAFDESKMGQITLK